MTSQGWLLYTYSIQISVMLQFQSPLMVILHVWLAILCVIVISLGFNFHMVSEPLYINFSPSIFLLQVQHLDWENILLTEGHNFWAMDQSEKIIFWDWSIAQNCALQQAECAPSQDVEAAIGIWKDINRSTKALIPCGNWTQEIEQIHTKLLIKHAKFTPKETEIGA